MRLFTRGEAGLVVCPYLPIEMDGTKATCLGDACMQWEWACKLDNKVTADDIRKMTDDGLVDASTSTMALLPTNKGYCAIKGVEPIVVNDWGEDERIEHDKRI